jgi:ribokinase
MGKVLVFGTINTDLVIYIDTLPVPGETVSGGKFISFPGGKGANQAVAAARAGARVEIYGCIGDDAFGKKLKINLEKAGVSTQHIIVKNGVNSGIAQIMVDKNGENMIAVAPGAGALLNIKDIKLPINSTKELIISLFQNEIPQKSTEAIIHECKEHGMVVLWNIAPAGGVKPSKKTLAAVDFLICNQTELLALAGKGRNEVLARKLLDWGVKNIIVTLGENGALFVTSREIFHQPAFPVNVVDTVGAGDCFCGVFASSLSLGMTVKESLRRASAAAAISTTRRGAQPSMPFAADIDDFLFSRQQ